MKNISKFTRHLKAHRPAPIILTIMASVVIGLTITTIRDIGSNGQSKTESQIQFVDTIYVESPKIDISTEPTPKPTTIDSASLLEAYKNSQNCTVCNGAMSAWAPVDPMLTQQNQLDNIILSLPIVSDLVSDLLSTAQEDPYQGYVYPYHYPLNASPSISKPIS